MLFKRHNPVSFLTQASFFSLLLALLSPLQSEGRKNGALFDLACPDVNNEACCLPMNQTIYMAKWKWYQDDFGEFKAPNFLIIKEWPTDLYNTLVSKLHDLNFSLSDEQTFKKQLGEGLGQLGWRTRAWNYTQYAFNCGPYPPVHYYSNGILDGPGMLTYADSSTTADLVKLIEGVKSPTPEITTTNGNSTILVATICILSLAVGYLLFQDCQREKRSPAQHEEGRSLLSKGTTNTQS